MEAELKVEVGGVLEGPGWWMVAIRELCFVDCESFVTGFSYFFCVGFTYSFRSAVKSVAGDLLLLGVCVLLVLHVCE